MKLLLLPYEALGAIRFGMKREELRAAVLAPVRTFRKTADAPALVDAFDDEGIYVHYDEHDQCHFVEVTTPSLPIFEGQVLLSLPFAELRDWLQRRGSNVEIDATGLTDFTLGLGLYAPFARDFPDEPVEAVSVLRRGYYD